MQLHKCAMHRKLPTTKNALKVNRSMRERAHFVYNTAKTRRKIIFENWNFYALFCGTVDGYCLYFFLENLTFNNLKMRKCLLAGFVILGGVCGIYTPNKCFCSMYFLIVALKYSSEFFSAIAFLSKPK